MMKVSEQLYLVNRDVSVIIARNESISGDRLMNLNAKLGEIIKEIRVLEDRLDSKI